MGKAYYYFAASLSMLDFDGKLPFSTDDFLADAQRLLTTKDYMLVDALLTDKDISQKNSIIDQWVTYNHNLKNGFAFYRAQKANRDPQQYVRGDYHQDPVVQQLIQDVEKASDPLEGEKILAKARWQFLSDLEVSEKYNLEAICLYGLKLKMMERFQNIQSPKGKEIYEELKKIEFPEGIVSRPS